jgi:hypothetical protein
MGLCGCIDAPTDIIDRMASVSRGRLGHISLAEEEMSLRALVLLLTGYFVLLGLCFWWVIACQ